MLQHPAPDQPHYRLMAQAYFGHIDPGYLWDRFDYKPLTGELIRKFSDYYGHKTGTAVGGKTPRGYLVTCIYGRNTMVHRVVYAWVTGAEPPDGMHIHHIDKNPSNNSWNNLEVLTAQEHQALHHKKPKLDMW